MSGQGWIRGLPVEARTCPHCGNKDLGFIEDNGAPSLLVLSLLCKAPCEPEENAFDGADGDESSEAVRYCAMTWDPIEYMPGSDYDRADL